MPREGLDHNRGDDPPALPEARHPRGGAAVREGAAPLARFNPGDASGALMKSLLKLQGLAEDVPASSRRSWSTSRAGKFRVNVAPTASSAIGGHVRAIGVMLFLGLLAAGLTVGGLVVLAGGGAATGARRGSALARAAVVSRDRGGVPRGDAADAEDLGAAAGCSAEARRALARAAAISVRRQPRRRAPRSVPSRQRSTAAATRRRDAASMRCGPSEHERARRGARTRSRRRRERLDRRRARSPPRIPKASAARTNVAGPREEPRAPRRRTPRPGPSPRERPRARPRRRASAASATGTAIATVSASATAAASGRTPPPRPRRCTGRPRSAASASVAREEAARRRRATRPSARGREHARKPERDARREARARGAPPCAPAQRRQRAGERRRRAARRRGARPASHSPPTSARNRGDEAPRATPLEGGGGVERAAARERPGAARDERPPTGRPGGPQRRAARDATRAPTARSHGSRTRRAQPRPERGEERWEARADGSRRARRGDRGTFLAF